MTRFLLSVFTGLALLALAGNASGQGGISTTISGVVTDSDGGVIPGADVTILHVATGVSNTTVSNGEGIYSFPSLPPGTYTVTVALQGFRTVVVNDVVVTSGVAGGTSRPRSRSAGCSEQVTVTSSSEIVQTQSPTVSSTITTNQITKLPLTSRSAMDFVNFLPGVSTPAGNRDATINGLPRGMINITLDGVNIQDNTLRSTDGFFAIVSPRLDAVEEVTVTTASQGAGDAGQGAVQVKFVTRSGTNNFNGSGYYYYRSDKLNANTWFNNLNGVAKPKLKQNQIGGRVGGPIVIPGLFDGHNKAFFFFNYEELAHAERHDAEPHHPEPGGRGRQLSPTGHRRRSTCWSSRPATARSRRSTRPSRRPAGRHRGGHQRRLARRRSTRTSIATRSTCRSDSMRRYPTFTLDYNLNEANRASFSYNYQKFTDFPDTLNSFDASFPGFPVAAGQESVRLSWSAPVRTVLRDNLVNEARVGYSGAPVKFFDELNTGMFTGTARRRRAGSPSTSRPSTRALTNAGPNAGAAVAQRQQPGDRGHRHLAEGLAQHHAGRLVHAVRRVGGELDAGAAAAVRDAGHRPGQRDVHGGELPRRVGAPT